MVLPIFWVLSFIAIVSAFLCVTRQSPVASALWLVQTMFTLAAMYVLLDAHFIAAIQVMVYAGAIMVLFLFVLMLLNVRREEDGDDGTRPLRGVALALVTLLVLQAGAVLLRSRPAPAPDFDASTLEMARVLFSPQFLYAFEATSILILAALVGAVVLAKKEL